MKILLVSPRTPDTFWSFRYALPFVGKRSTSPPLGLLTVAALLPRHWELRLIDLDISRLKDADLRWADFVLLGGMIIHRRSAHAVARRCRALGRTVIAGGPLFTTCHEEFDEIDHFVLGEAEELLPEVVADMERGTLRRVYRAERFPPMELSPIPRWDLLDRRRYATMAVQFSRGCPHDCEFCDVVVLNGRVPRTKAPAQVLAEFDALHALGWRRDIFVVDDNFIGDRPRARAMLEAMIEWRRARGNPTRFLTEVTVDLARDRALLASMVEAGFDKVFVGIETPDRESLLECHKLQNARLDLEAAVHTIQEGGLEVMGGFIVGFDHDRPDVFERQFEFIQRAGVVTAMVGVLTALPNTRLYRRLREEGRLLTESVGDNTRALCNFTPKIGRETLERGYRDLMHRLYAPEAFYRRARVFLDHHRGGAGPQIGAVEIAAILRSTWVLGIREPGRRAYWRFLAGVARRHPGRLGTAIALAIHGHHFRRTAALL